MPAETGSRAEVPHASAAVAATVIQMDLAKFDIISDFVRKNHAMTAAIIVQQDVERAESRLEAASGSVWSVFADGKTMPLEANDASVWVRRNGDWFAQVQTQKYLV
ncbi:MAG TPA: hypothetical protein VGL17_11860 [Gemmatimonadaceae bacterium]